MTETLMLAALALAGAAFLVFSGVVKFGPEDTSSRTIKPVQRTQADGNGKRKSGFGKR